MKLCGVNHTFHSLARKRILTTDCNSAGSSGDCVGMIVNNNNNTTTPMQQNILKDIRIR